MRRLALPLLCLVAATACVHDPYGYGGGPDYDYAGDAWDGFDNHDLTRFDPWLTETEEGSEIRNRSMGPNGWDPESVRELNIRFRRFADTNRDLRLTDEEIRLALVRCATSGWSW